MLYFVSRTEPYISCSPDGIINSQLTLGVLIQTNECVNVPFHEVFLNEIISNARKCYFQNVM